MNSKVKPQKGQMDAEIVNEVDWRPWFREPWVWFIIALPACAVVGCAITIWLAITRPDYLVVDDGEYQHIRSELQAAPDEQKAPTQTGTTDSEGNGDR